MVLTRRFSPMTDFAYLFDQMDRIAQDALGNSPRTRVATLPVDVYDRGEEVVVRALVPGIHAESLDITIDVENVTASIEDGILWLTMPKAPEAKPRRIPVGAGATHFHEVEATTSS